MIGLYIFAGCGILVCAIAIAGIVIIVLDLRRMKREHRAFYAQWQQQAVREAELIVRGR